MTGKEQWDSHSMGDWKGLGQSVVGRVCDWGGDSHRMTQRTANVLLRLLHCSLT